MQLILDQGLAAMTPLKVLLCVSAGNHPIAWPPNGQLGELAVLNHLLRGRKVSKRERERAICKHSSRPSLSLKASEYQRGAETRRASMINPVGVEHPIFGIGAGASSIPQHPQPAPSLSSATHGQAIKYPR